MSRVGRFTAALLLLAPIASAEESHLEVAPGEVLRVTTVGAGVPVLLVPGLLGSGFGFRRVLPRLAEAGYRAIVVEPLGVGGSSKPEQADYSLTAQADRLAAVLDALRIDEAILVAHAVGGSIALRLACRHPERVLALVSLDGGPAEAAATPGFRRAMRFAPLLKLFGGGRRLRGRIRTALVERSADPRWVTEEVVDGYMGAAAEDFDAVLRAYRGIARAREPEALAPRLREIRCPLRLVVGAHPHEGGISAPEVALLRERIVSFAVDSVPGAGHFVSEENPDAVVAAVERAHRSAAVRTAATGGGR